MKTEYKVVQENGNTYWYLDGKFHRTDGPAIEHSDGSKFWYIGGKRHRTDGPAIERADGSKAWYLNGKTMTEAEFRAETDKQDSCDGKVVEIEGRKYRLVRTE